MIPEMISPDIVQNCWCELHGILAYNQAVFELVNILQLHRPNHIFWKMNAISTLLYSLYISICFPLLDSNSSDAFPLSLPP